MGHVTREPRAAMLESPRFSFQPLVFAWLLCVFPTMVVAQETKAPGDTTRHVQRLAPQRITGTRLTASDSASQSLGARANTIPAVDVRGVAPGPASTAQLLTRLNGVSAFDDQGTRAQPTLDLRGWTLSPVVGVPQGVSVFLDGVRIN